MTSGEFLDGLYLMSRPRLILTDECVKCGAVHEVNGLYYRNHAQNMCDKCNHSYFQGLGEQRWLNRKLPTFLKKE